MTVLVKQHTRKAPAKVADPFQSLIEANVAARKANAERVKNSKYSIVTAWEGFSQAFRGWRQS